MSPANPSTKLTRSQICDCYMMMMDRNYHQEEKEEPVVVASDDVVIQAVWTWKAGNSNMVYDEDDDAYDGKENTPWEDDFPNDESTWAHVLTKEQKTAIIETAKENALERAKKTFKERVRARRQRVGKEAIDKSSPRSSLENNNNNNTASAVSTDSKKNSSKEKRKTSRRGDSKISKNKRTSSRKTTSKHGKKLLLSTVAPPPLSNISTNSGHEKRQHIE
eukprot:scaffold7757_cov68-Cylindrotheca_fusiformis.AAC.2